MALIEASGLSVDTRLKAVGLTVQSGEMLGLIGPNGAGKTTLLHCLAGIEPCQGEVHLQNTPLEQFSVQQRARQIGLLPQRCQSAWALSVRDIVGLGRLPWGDESNEQVEWAAHQTGVTQWLDQPVDKLSGGEQARVWLARVLAGNPQLLLADEPLASLDLYYQCRVLELLRSYAQEARGVIVALHDLAQAARYCDRLCMLHQGQVYAQGTPEQVLTVENLRAVYQVEASVDLQIQPPVISVIG